MHEPDHERHHVPEHLLTILDMLNLGILAVDQEGRVMFANRAAEALMQYRDLCSGRTCCGSVNGRKTIDRRLRAAIAGRERDAGPLSLIGPADKSLTVVTATLRAGPPAAAEEPAAVLFISDPAARLSYDVRAIARLYQLTSAEARLLAALLGGKRVGEYAKEARITLNTAKGYLKQLFSKMHSRSQADLVRRVLTNPLLALVSSSETDADPARADE